MKHCALAGVAIRMRRIAYHTFREVNLKLSIPKLTAMLIAASVLNILAFAPGSADAQSVTIEILPI